MPTYSIRLFGRFSLQRDGEVLTDVETSKAQELLCYLLLHRDRQHSREVLAELLWEGASPTQSKKYLRQALWQLNTMLDSKAEPDRGALRVEPAWVRANSEADLWLDVAVFEAAFAQVEGIPGHQLTPETSSAIQVAVDLYRGDLLQDWYQDWTIFERERLQHMYLSMLDKLMGSCERYAQYESGIVYGSRILHLDRAQERAHRSLMRLHYRAGDRTAALRQYRRCVAALAEELDVAPAESTQALYQQIRADQVQVADQAHPADASATTAGSLSRIQTDLMQLRTILQDVQLVLHHVQAEQLGRR